MSAAVIPEGGLELPAIAGIDGSDGNGGKLSQILQLRLENGMLLDMMKAARQPSRHPQLSCGRTIKLHYGTTTRTLVSTPAKNPSYLYFLEASSPTQTVLEGELSHELELPKNDETPAESDEAIAQLTSRLASAKEARQNQQIKFVPDSAVLPQGKKHSSAQVNKGQLVGLGISQHRARLSETNIQNLPDSPAMAPTKPPVFTTQAQQRERIQSAKQKEQAIRKAAVHLLAHRQISTKQVSESIRCSLSEAQSAMPRIAMPSKSDAGKWQLKDSAYKDLDPWAFGYKDPEERNLAIENAITAFDRQRLSGNGPEFQRLLPTNERGKGKSLSRLGHLNKGPIKLTGTPKIQVQQPDGAKRKADHDEAHDSQDGKKVRKTNASGKDKKALDAKTSKPESSKPTKGAGAASDGKLGPKKNILAKKVNGASLSAEFVGDSDDDDGLDDGPSALPSATEPDSDIKDDKKAQIKPKKPSNVPRTATPKDDESSTKGLAKPRPKPRQEDNVTGKKTAAKPRTELEPVEKHQSGKSGPLADALKRKAPGSSAGDARAAKRSRGGSSPHKPSPLGSSPPTNASDTGERELSSSTSSTPLIQVKNQSPVLVKNPGKAQNSVERQTKKVAVGQKPNGQGTSGLTNGHVDGNRDIVNRMTPPSSDSQSSTPLSARANVMEKMRVFKEVSYPEYAKLYKEVSDMKDPPDEKVQALRLQHKLLAEQKAGIVRAFKDFDV